ncbi:RND transporter [Nibricoccus aquaticus]|uniref:RND transporter n=1 Tax=Nibricoccus aquaticus TaxID=2576891 RepID=A0A290QNR0_9BACT|nr:HlyD family efflux transporter periplasmic adaptor subunit [Nibricoccus aquaticus]ATC66042.1 RND transporter [Nibricoccus aquaticus]
MDAARPKSERPRKQRRLVAGVIAAALISCGVLGLMVLKPAAPTVERGLVLIDTVKRGSMLRQVRGVGTLVPEEIRWIASRTAGRVDRVLLRPGAAVTEESVILVLTNPEVEQAAANADSQLTAVEAELVNLNVTLEREVLAAESALASARAEREQSRLRAELNEELFKQGLLSSVDYKLSRVNAEHAGTRFEIEEKRFKFARDSIAPQLAVKQAEVSRLRAQAKLRHDELASLSVRAGMRGVLQILPVEIGSQVQTGVNLARVADPTRLKAQIRIAETQTRDIQVGQRVTVDTRNGVIEGDVERIDPSVQASTVAVDVRLSGELPRGARPDLSIEGVIEIERLDNVLYVTRPAFGQESGAVGLFKLEADGVHASLTRVMLGRSSVSLVEIVDGVQPGDRVILSDMSQWSAHERIQLQ